MNTPNPIKRNKNLVQLSRDHHDGLLICWKLRQGVSQNVSADRMIAFITQAFTVELEPHFQQEEQLLFVKLSEDDILRLKAEEQHAAIRAMVKKMKDEKGDTTQLRRFANVLDEHIRFEERALFPHVEKMFTVEELETIGGYLEAGHLKKKAFTWTDEFWIKVKVQK